MMIVIAVVILGLSRTLPRPAGVVEGFVDHGHLAFVAATDRACDHLSDPLEGWCAAISVSAVSLGRHQPSSARSLHAVFPAASGA
jgi:hypothetical protein